MSLIFNTKIKNLKQNLSKSLKINNNNSTIRNRKIVFSDVFYFNNLYNININSTYDTVYNDLLIDKSYNNISKNAFVKKRNDLSIDLFTNTNNNLLKYVYNDINYNNPNKERLIGIDGSNMNFLLELKKDGFKTNKHNSYTKGIISCLFDIDNQIPINYTLSESFNERNICIDQIKYLNKNDILVGDRGYYSDDVVKNLLNNQINFVFRLKSSDLHVKELNNINKNELLFDFINEDKIIKFKIIKFQTVTLKDVNIKYEDIEDIDNLNKQSYDINQFIIKQQSLIHNLVNEKNDIIKNNKTINKIKNNDHNFIKILKTNNLIKKQIMKQIDIIKIIINDSYKLFKIIKNKINQINKINDSIYYIITNKIDYSFDKLSEIYKKRWCIETNFRFAKEKFKFKTMNSKSINIIMQNIYVTQFIFILESYIEFLLNKYIKKDHKLNRSTLLNVMEKYLIKHLLFNKNNKKIINDINDILNIIIKNIIKIKVVKEARPRIKKRPGSKWNGIPITT
jgi:hypothetical protein